MTSSKDDGTHEVDASRDSTFLVTIAWPSQEKLLKLEHRGYGT